MRGLPGTLGWTGACSSGSRLDESFDTGPLLEPDGSYIGRRDFVLEAHLGPVFRSSDWLSARPTRGLLNEHSRNAHSLDGQVFTALFDGQANQRHLLLGDLPHEAVGGVLVDLLPQLVG